jgi:putative phosphoribosyl transferase
MNEDALAQLRSLPAGRSPSPKRLEIIPRATHLFEEPGTLAVAARLASQWFTRYLNHDV